ncbi:unnamed protein product [Clavelina lepadiformis]|uniref:Ig-like domain-containing protein n=1 Tax=Clavelina lepadiformis TaxID=159417 RepID=A0ABP0FVX7_CLALP
MMRLLLLAFFGFATKAVAYDRLVGFHKPRSSHHVVILDGGVDPSIGVNWTCDNPNAVIANPSSSSTNVTLKSPGTYNCKLSRSDTTIGPDNLILSTNLRMEIFLKLPVTILAGSITQNLIRAQYQFLSLSHHYYASNNYLPNVAKFFKAGMGKMTDTIHKLITYVLAKHATTKVKDGQGSPDYTVHLFRHGFGPDFKIKSEKPTQLQKAFADALKIEKAIVHDLTSTKHWAEYLDDAEVSCMATSCGASNPDIMFN